jgi:hypothetical protein
LGLKNPFRSQTNSTGKRLITQALKENKTLVLLAFAVIYGLIFINYIDVITSGSGIGGYHLWLTLMYFVPFAILSVIDIKNFKLTIGLGLTASLMNDVFYGVVRNLMSAPYDLARYYSLWLIPQSTKLFSLNLGFTVIEVQSWMMAFSIYLRIIVASLLLYYSWKVPLTGMRTKLSLNVPRLRTSPNLNSSNQSTVFSGCTDAREVQER